MAADHLASDSLLQLPRIWTAPMAAPTDIGACVRMSRTETIFKELLVSPFATIFTGDAKRPRSARIVYSAPIAAWSSLKNELLQRFAQRHSGAHRLC